MWFLCFVLKFMKEIQNFTTVQKTLLATLITQRRTLPILILILTQSLLLPDFKSTYYIATMNAMLKAFWINDGNSFSKGSMFQGSLIGKLSQILYLMENYPSIHVNRFREASHDATRQAPHTESKLYE